MSKPTFNYIEHLFNVLKEKTPNKSAEIDALKQQYNKNSFNYVKLNMDSTFDFFKNLGENIMHFISFIDGKDLDPLECPLCFYYVSSHSIYLYIHHCHSLSKRGLVNRLLKKLIEDSKKDDYENDSEDDSEDDIEDSKKDDYEDDNEDDSEEINVDDKEKTSDHSQLKTFVLAEKDDCGCIRTKTYLVDSVIYQKMIQDYVNVKIFDGINKGGQIMHNEVYFSNKLLDNLPSDWIYTDMIFYDGDTIRTDKYLFFRDDLECENLQLRELIVDYQDLKITTREVVIRKDFPL